MNDWTQDRIYRRTPCGETALTTSHPGLPSDYLRLLRIVQEETHSDVIRGRLRQYSDGLLADWLGELEELGYLSSRPADYTQELDFTLLLESKPEGPWAPEERWRLDSEAQAACAALYDKGSYLSAQRLCQSGTPKKRFEDTIVLIVEDDPDQVALADLRVRMAGYRVRVARSRLELRLDFLAQPLPDLVLLDVMLPDANGFDILSAMRSSPKLAILPVIMVTALDGADNIRRGLALGADGYITKPYSKKILEMTISAVLGNSDDAHRDTHEAARRATKQWQARCPYAGGRGEPARG